MMQTHVQFSGNNLERTSNKMMRSNIGYPALVCGHRFLEPLQETIENHAFLSFASASSTTRTTP